MTKLKSTTSVTVFAAHGKLSADHQKPSQNKPQDSRDTNEIPNKDEGFKNEIKSLVIMNPSFNQSINNMKYLNHQNINSANSFKKASEERGKARVNNNLVLDSSPEIRNVHKALKSKSNENNMNLSHNYNSVRGDMT